MRVFPVMIVTTAAAGVLGGILLAGADSIGADTEGEVKLTDEEKRVIEAKGTERPFTGEYLDHREDGTYTCKRCGAKLFRSEDKFDSGSGWPSFDDALPGAVTESQDPDGARTEIACARCGAHLGHVFRGEGFTNKEVRHCVNSLSLDFLADKGVEGSARAYFAGGCYWGVAHFMSREPGVLSVTSGFMGGHVPAPTYEQVCGGETGHLEVVQVVFDPAKTSFDAVARVFFEIHDPTQEDGQGPDLGSQYRSAIFYTSEEQRRAALELIRILTEKGFRVVTELVPAGRFWPGPDYHQDYYARTGKTPYCHARTKRF